jgi:beta-lactamase regulating signal transducer with metallopeptidase domain
VETLANWLWQGTALAAATTIALRVWPRVSATARYRVWWIAMVIVLALPFLPLEVVSIVERPLDVVRIVAPAPVTVSLPALPSWPVTLAAGLWIGWMAWSLAGVAVALRALAATKRRCRDIPEERQARLACWRSIRDRGRRARLVVSDDVRSASVLGLSAPAIAVSPVLLRALDDRDLDAILVHEWAHVQRRDDLARLAQRLVRAVAGLHPAVWWIDRQMQVDRETACDDWAIRLTGSAARYAACLTRLASLELSARDSALMPAAFTSSELTTRVVRLLDRQRSTSIARPVTATLVGVPIMTAAAAIVASIELVTAAAPLQISPIVTPPAARRAAGTIEPVRIESGRQRVPPLPRRSPVQQVAAPAPAAIQGPPAGGVTGDAPRPAVSTVEPGQDSARVPVAASDAILDAGALPGEATPVGSIRGEVSGKTPAAPAASAPVTPWGAAATAGASVGRGSQKAAVATAGFFSKLGKSIAGSF